MNFIVEMVNIFALFLLISTSAVADTLNFDTEIVGKDSNSASVGFMFDNKINGLTSFAGPIVEIERGADYETNTLGGTGGIYGSNIGIQLTLMTGSCEFEYFKNAKCQVNAADIAAKFGQIDYTNGYTLFAKIDLGVKDVTIKHNDVVTFVGTTNSSKIVGVGSVMPIQDFEIGVTASLSHSKSNYTDQPIIYQNYGFGIFFIKHFRYLP